MGTLAKGNAAESAVLNAFVQAGFDVLVPFGEGQPYDLVVHLRGDVFLRVQCKNARRNRGCVVFNNRTTDHGRGPQPYLGLADIFGVYDPLDDAVYLVPVSKLPGFEGRLRVQPARNNQRLKMRYAVEYEIGRWTHQALIAVANEGQSTEVAVVQSA